MYQDDRSTFYLIKSPEGRLYLHTKLTDPQKPSNFKHFRTVLECLEVELAERGIDKLYTTADSEPNFRFCESMGFQTNREVFLDQYEIMVKDLCQ